MDVGGRFSGTVTGVMNMAGALAASLTAIVYGALFGAGYWVAPFPGQRRGHAARRTDLAVPHRPRQERRLISGLLARLAITMARTLSGPR
jgi:hypothetical protein